ncbi:hypothetical protein C5S42_12595 [Candidatus Methanomarinus sp.]|nr:hypothetical protein C5S42_12595 [ANME-2 cluster archaeon]
MSELVKLETKNPDIKQKNLNIHMRRRKHPQYINTSADHILYLQRTIGNQAVSRLLESGTLQAKLKIGQPGDIYEQEADRMAERVMHMPEPQVQRQGKKEESEATPAVAVATKTTPAPDTQKLSGSHWTGIAETYSTSLEDLADPFKTNAKNFIAAMETAGATVSINTTKRPIQRAWLMHHAWIIAKGGSAPTNDPHNTGIIWDHGTPEETKKKAEEMIGPSGFNMAYNASLTSRHFSGNAVDMTISNMPDKFTFKHEGKDVTIDLGSPNTGQNTKLHTAADSYFKVKKLVSDAPHWSDNGH